MKYIENLVLGSGISSFLYFKTSKKKPNVFTSRGNKILKSKNFYENDTLGGNTNIWGGYINLRRHKLFLKNNKYKKLFNKNIFKVNRIFSNNIKFENTYCLMNINNKVFRINRKHFGNKIYDEKIKKIEIKKKNIEVISNNRRLQVKKLILCIGNLSLLRLLYQSNWLKNKDIISFDDGDCNYVFSFSANNNKDYFIPMPLSNIAEKIIFKKSKSYKIIKNSIILQKFSGTTKNYNFSCSEIMKMDETKIRYFLSNHIANLKINNIPVRKFIKSKSKKINVFCTGTVKKYLPGPIIQDLILDIIKNK
mgnify:CR=1 FL=1